MATTKPRTTAKRPTASRSVRVTKKKQGVSKKQAFMLIAILAVIGVVAVVASKASSADYVYIGVPKQKDAYNVVNVVQKSSSDGASSADYELQSYQTLNNGSLLSRDKTKMLVTVTGKSKLYASSTGALIKEMPKNVTDYLMNAIVSNGRTVVFMPGDKTVLAADASGDGFKTIDLYSGSIKTFAVPKGYIQFGQQNVSRDGKKLVYTAFSQAEQKDVIITSNIDGSSAKVVRKSNGDAGYPQWSNDGKKFSYYESDELASASNVTVRLKVANADGSGDKVLTSVIANHQKPGSGDRNYYEVRQYTESSSSFTSTHHDQWSSGSTSILFKRITPGHVENLFTVDIKTGKTTAVTSNTSPNTVISYYGVTASNRIVYSYGPANSPANMVYRKQDKVVTVGFDGSARKMIYSGAGPIWGILWW